MRVNNKIVVFLSVLAIISCLAVKSQTVPLGIHYQAVARDNYGKELSNTEIDVRFSILYGDPEGEPVYQEIHQKKRTTYYGVFSLVIGDGIHTKGTSFENISWESGTHYLKVEVKFDNDYRYMGTMQFLAVPYALYARKSLEPGPQGPQGVQGLKGDPGNPATDNQTLSFEGTNLSLSKGGGGTPSVVNLSSLNLPHSLSIFTDTMMLWEGTKIISKVELPNQIQDLTLDVNNKLLMSKSSAAQIDLTKFLDNTDNQDLSLNSANNILSLTRGTSVDLTPLKQDLTLTGNTLTVTNTASPTPIDLTKYMDNTDNQQLTYNPSNYTLSLTNGGSAIIGNLIAFRAKKLLSTAASSMQDVTFIPSTVEYNDGNAFNAATGDFIAPSSGLYTFVVSYYADGLGGSRKLSIYYNMSLYEDMAVEIASLTQITARSITMKLNVNDNVRLVINTGTATQTGTGSFSGFRIY